MQSNLKLKHNSKKKFPGLPELDKAVDRVQFGSQSIRMGPR